MLASERMNKFLKSLTAATNHNEESIARAYSSVFHLELMAIKDDPAFGATPPYLLPDIYIQLPNPPPGWMDDTVTVPVNSSVHKALIEMYETHAPDRDPAFDLALRNMADTPTQVTNHTACTLDGVLFKSTVSRRKSRRTDNTGVMYVYKPEHNKVKQEVRSA